MFAENLKKVMDQKGITSAALARKSGFSKGAVSQWRNGIYTPSHENMLVLAEVLQCGVEELTGNVKPAEPTPGKTNKVTLTVEEAAKLMHKRQTYVAQGLQEGRPGFEFGSAVKTSGKWSYFISVAKFTEITGIPVPAEI
ncbi:helix-turn-helix transcriptional regulator [Lachnospiraceae bacterium 38-10]